jgi:hypothetical protein
MLKQRATGSSSQSTYKVCLGNQSCQHEINYQELVSPQSLMMEAETMYKILEINSILTQLITVENFTAFICHEGFKYTYLLVSFQKLKHTKYFLGIIRSLFCITFFSLLRR